jgi:hypothetical protein
MSAPVAAYRLVILIRRVSLPHASTLTATSRFPITPNLNVLGILPALFARLLRLLRGLIRLHGNSGLSLVRRSLLHFAGK